MGVGRGRGGGFPSSLRILFFRFSPSLFSIRAALHYLNAWKRRQGNHQTSIHLQRSNETTLPTDRAGTALETIFPDPEIEVAGPRPLPRFGLWAPTNGEQMMFIRKIQIFIRNSLFLQSRFSHVFRARITQITRVISRNASVISSPTVTAAVLHGSDESAILVESKTMAATQRFSSEGNLQREVCSLIAQKSSEAIKDHGFFAVGFSGGSLPKIVCPGLLSLQIDFKKWRIFFCDERYVALTDADSNYVGVKQHLLDKLSVAPEQILTINHDIPLDEAAKEYESHLKGWYPGDDVPSLDMLLLGMGPDGHTCSLFPGHPLLLENSRLVAPISDSPKPPPCRITLTYPIINASKCAAFVSTGSSKASVLQQVLEGNAEEPLPAARVRPSNGELHWFLDDAAASLLTKK